MNVNDANTFTDCVVHDCRENMIALYHFLRRNKVAGIPRPAWSMCCAVIVELWSVNACVPLS